MICPSCAHENRSGAKFCEECASPLKRVCAGCNAELRPSAKFCDECGAAVAGVAAAMAPPIAASGVRKTVTILFADLVGSTALHERLDPESVRRFMERYYEAMRGAIESHGGSVNKFLGDGVLAVFGMPRVAEDDALRAVRAGVAMQQAFRALAEQQRGLVGKTGLRVALNTGEVVANDDNELIGDPVNVAARLQELGADGDVVLGDSTSRLVASSVTLSPLGSFALKGRAIKVAAYRVESLERPVEATTTTFVGRDEELARIDTAYATAVETPATRLAVVLGSPGLGKSRLIGEFAGRLEGSAAVIDAHCGQASAATFAPLADALRELLRTDSGAGGEDLRAAILAVIPEAHPERVRIAAGIAVLIEGTPASPEETFFVVRRFFSGLAASHPVVLVIDDLQWAEPLLIDLVEHLVQWGGGIPLLVLIGARPELREKRLLLTTVGGVVSDVVTLSGLDAGAAMRLAANIVGATDLPAAVAAKVLATSEGNPLFVRELVRMLVHEGALKREGDRWTTGTALAALEMPPTIHALLAARIERLHPDERLVLERAAVVGRHFSRGAVTELLPRDFRNLDSQLESLRRGELIERDTGWFLGEPALRFHHVLIRDAAYRQLLKGTRAELHTRFANWVLAGIGDSVEHDEIVGWHLEQAHQHLSELGPIDAEGRAIGERASERLAAAGRRALARDDLTVASSLLGRALHLLDEEAPARAELALDWCEALLAAGDVAPAAGAIEQLGRLAGDSERLRAWRTCFEGEHTVLTAPEGLPATADEVAAAAEALAVLGDAAGEAKAHYVLALVFRRLGRIGACEAALDRALAAARRVDGDRRRANTVLAIAPLAALWGPSPVTRASGRCLDVVRVLRITQGAPAVEAVALSCQGVLEALRGRTDAARRMIASSRKMVEELGITQRLLEADVFGGLVDLLEGDAAAAEQKLRLAYHGLRDLGLGIDAARAAAQLARALLAQDRVDDAEALSHESEALAGDDLKAAIAWRGVRAEALARRGETRSAVEFARQAVEIAAATDALLDHADARLALAAALRSAGQDREAMAEERRAHELWEAKGATLLAERARSGGGRKSGVAAASEHATEPFEAESEAEPLARFDALMRQDPAESKGRPAAFENAAARADAGLFRCFNERDWAGVEAFAAQDLVFDERRRMLRNTCGRDIWLEQFRVIYDVPESRCTTDLLVTRGDRLALSLHQFSGMVAGGGGPLTIGDHYVVHEVDNKGRIKAIVLFDLEDEELAYAELEARSQKHRVESEVAPQPAHFANAATATAGPVIRCLASHDWAGFKEQFAEDFRCLDRRRVVQLDFDRDGYVAFTREVADGRKVSGRSEVLATRGDRLSLVRSTFMFADEDVGPSEIAFLLVTRVDDLGRINLYVRFDADDIAGAYAELDARFNAGEAAAFPHAWYSVHQFVRGVEAGDWDALVALCAPELIEYDHRSLAVLGTTRGAEAWVENFRKLVDLSPDAVYRVDHFLPAPRGYYVHGNWLGTHEGGEFLMPLNAVIELNGRGWVIRADIYDDTLEPAMARLAELAEPVSRSRFENAATRQLERFFAAWAARELARAESTLAPEMRQIDRRDLMHLELDLKQHLESLRYSFGMATSSFSYELIATRGDRLMLGRIRQNLADGDVGPSEIEYLCLIETDTLGRQLTLIRWNSNDLEAAYAELDARYDAGEAAAHMTNWRVSQGFVRCVANQDWDALVALCADEMVEYDHRSLAVLGVTRGAKTWVENFRKLAELAPDTVYRVHHFLPAARGYYVHGGWYGTREGGAYEIPLHAVAELDERGKLVRADIYDDAIEPALARLAELAEPSTPCEPFSNAAARAAGRIAAAWMEKDWERFEGLFLADFHLSERRRAVQLELDRDEMFVFIRSLGEHATTRTIELETLATRGDRLALVRWSVEIAGDDVGPSEIVSLNLFETDTRGALTAGVRWDDDDLDAAYAELDARWAASDAATHSAASTWVTAFQRGFADRDWDAMSELCARNQIAVNHRTVGWGTLSGPAAWVSTMQALVELAADTRLSIYHLRTNPRGFLWTSTWHGTRDGGAYETPLVVVGELDAQGKEIRMDVWDIEQIAVALARFEEIRPGATPDPQLEPAPNTASRWYARWEETFHARDWESMAALMNADMRYEDRRSLFRFKGDKTLAMSSARERARIDARSESRLVGTAGDRVAILRVLYSGGPDDGRFESEVLTLIEVDEHGLLAAVIHFDPDDSRAAQREAWARWIAIEPWAADVLAPLGELLDAFNDQNAEKWRAACADDIVVDDHRLAGMGRIDGAEAYTASVVALWELAPVTRSSFGWCWPAFDKYGAITVLNRTGTVPGGGEFESEYLYLHLVANGHITRIELFETHALDKALARFEELRPRV